MLWSKERQSKVRRSGVEGEGAREGHDPLCLVRGWGGGPRGKGQRRSRESQTA